MSHVVVINLGLGNLQSGCANVIAQVSNRVEQQYPAQYVGSLPPAPELERLYQRWQLLYREFYRPGIGFDQPPVEPQIKPQIESQLESQLGPQLGPQLEHKIGDHPGSPIPRKSSTRAIKISSGGVTHFSEVEFSDLAQQLQKRLNQWLNAESFHPIDRKLSRLFEPSDAIQVIIQTSDPILRRLPWHLWNFFEDFPQAEVALSVAEYERVSRPPAPGPVRILAVLGNSNQIDVQIDRQAIAALPNATTLFLTEPSYQELHDQLWDERGWDILFFAGHSQTESQMDGETGRLYLRSGESLTLDQLRHALGRAIRQGLKLAIFNSCDGLGLAQALADLHIPQVIVMRELVPDQAAQMFFRAFLDQFAQGHSLYAAVREAREKLEKLQDQYPCVTWLPVICQNPAEEPMRWRMPPESLGFTSAQIAPAETAPAQLVPQLAPAQIALSQVTPPRQSPKRRKHLLLASLLATVGMLGLRYLGGLQALELRAFDQLMRLRPAEPPDPRLLVVAITEQDVQQQNAEERRGASLSDRALAQLLAKLRPHQPRVIGLDLYRDFAIDPASGLAAQLQQTPQFVAVCEVGENSGTRPLQTIPSQRLSFSDLPIDRDGVVRRQILGMATAPDSACQTDTAFSLRLAQLYLTTQGIQSSRDDRGTLHLGPVAFPQLRSDSGGYHQLDALGYQIMLNYRAASLPAAQVTLGEVFSGALDDRLADLVRDRVVLIGTVAPSFKDYFLTPYSQADPMQKLPGVVVHAQMTSQLLSAVLDRRPLLVDLPNWGEAVWIWGWAILGGGLLWCRSRWQVGLAGVGAIVLLLGVSYGGLLLGVWLPLVPALGGLLVSAGAAAVARLGCRPGTLF